MVSCRWMEFGQLLGLAVPLANEYAVLLVVMIVSLVQWYTGGMRLFWDLQNPMQNHCSLVEI